MKQTQQNNKSMRQAQWSVKYEEEKNYELSEKPDFDTCSEMIFSDTYKYGMLKNHHRIRNKTMMKIGSNY